MVLLRALSLLMVALAGFLTGSPHATAHTYSSTDLQVLGTASAGLAHQGRSRILEWLRRQPAVRSAQWVAAGRTLDMRFRDGFQAAVLARSTGTVALPSRTLFHSLAQSYAPGGQALVLEPFAAQLGLGSQSTDIEASALQNAGFHVDELYNSAVTVASMANISRYNVVYIHTHSGVAPGGEGLVATGQLANSNDPTIQAMVNNESLVVVGVSGSSDLYYAIASGFVQRQVGQFPAHSIFFANGCNLLDAQVFWKALQAKGVGALVSWDLEASSKDNYLAGAAFFNDMGQGMTIDQTIKTEQSVGLGISNENGVTAHLGYLGDGTITLQEAASSPPGSGPPTATSVPATAAPTATPTGVPPTATPTNTPIVLNATATPGITPPPPPSTPTGKGKTPLTVNLKRSIWPGWWQHVAVKSTPKTVISFRVTYPNGDQQSATRTTNAQGTASYAYKQASSKITRTNRVVGIVIKAGSGATQTIVRQTYRDHLGAIDLWAQPRTPQPAGMVHLWVHTRPRTRVQLILSVARHQVERLSTRTGPRGWAHPGRRITGRLSPTRGSKVTVVGSARIGGHAVTSQTWFTVG